MFPIDEKAVHTLVKKCRLNVELKHLVRESWMYDSSIAPHILQTIRLRKAFQNKWDLPKFTYVMETSSSRIGQCTWCDCNNIQLYCVDKALELEGQLMSSDWACELCFPYVSDL